MHFIIFNFKSGPSKQIALINQQQHLKQKINFGDQEMEIDIQKSKAESTKIDPKTSPFHSNSDEIQGIKLEIKEKENCRGIDLQEKVEIKLEKEEFQSYILVRYGTLQVVLIYRN